MKSYRYRNLIRRVALCLAIVVSPAASGIAIDSAAGIAEAELRGQQLADLNLAIGLGLHFDADGNRVGEFTAFGYGSSDGSDKINRFITAGHAEVEARGPIAETEIRFGSRAFTNPDATVKVTARNLNPDYSPLYTAFRGTDAMALETEPLIGYEALKLAFDSVPDGAVLELAECCSRSVAGE